MDNLPSTIESFSCQFDDQIDDILAKWQNDFDDISIRSSIRDDRSSKIDQPISTKLNISGLFDIPLVESQFPTSVREKANREAEKQLNRSYAVELNPNEKLGDFRLRVPQMAIEVNLTKLRSLFFRRIYLSYYSLMPVSGSVFY